MELKFLFTHCLISFFLFIGMSTYSQTRTCGMVEHMNQQLQDPDFAREYEKKQTEFKVALAQRLESRAPVFIHSNPIIIPVAVHFPEAQETDRACLEALAQNQIDILNADYTATNSDINLWDTASSFYPGVNLGMAAIEFCIATQNHPVGGAGGLLEGGPAVTIGYNFGNGADQDANWSGYMNFLVKDIGSGLLGYSPLGGNVLAGQSVVMNINAFGSGAGCSGSGIVPGAPYDLGRTVTHELGHFYNLDHPWGGVGACNLDDGIADTPNISSPNGGCPAPGSVDGCEPNEKALTMNYMDYVNDACMFMLTEGQTDVVDAYISTIQNQFKQNTTPCGVTASFNLSAMNNSYRTCGNDAVFDLSYFSINGFDSTVALEVSNVPQGVSATLSQDEINTPGDFSLALTNIDQLDLADYTVTVTASGSGLSASANLTLSIVYTVCSAAGNLDFETATTAVVFNNINQRDRATKTAPYNDFTSVLTDINRESSYDLSVRVHTDGDFEVATTVWIDWNQNCNFSDPGESYDLGSATAVFDEPTTNSPRAIIIPSDAALGTTTMRVSTRFVNTNPNFSACQTGFNGEVEDYSINVLESIADYGNEFIDLVAFPNPSSGNFTLKFQTNSSADFEVHIYDIRGRRIYAQEFKNRINFNQTIALERMPTGIYLMTVSSDSEQVTKRILIN